METSRGSFADTVAALQVTRTVGLRETWFFGLQFLDSRGLISWLDPTKKVSSAFRFHSYGQCVKFLRDEKIFLQLVVFF